MLSQHYASFHLLSELFGLDLARQLGSIWHNRVFGLY